MDKKTYCSVQQKNILVEIVSADKDLVSGKFSSTFTSKESQKRWAAIAEIVNACPGANKDWRHWRKTWQDIRSKTKSKQAKHNKYSAGTGGGPLAGSTLTRAEEIVLGTINAQAICGNTSVMESGGTFEFISSEKDDVEPAKEPEESDDAGETIYLEYCDEAAAEKESKKVENQNLSTPCKSKAKLAAERLQSSSSATVVLAEVSKNELILKERYYNKKLEYLERQTVAMEKIANALVEKVI